MVAEFSQALVGDLRLTIFDGDLLKRDSSAGLHKAQPVAGLIGGEHDFDELALAVLRQEDKLNRAFKV